jgi:hypothetical protein
MESEGMVHALEIIHTLLKPGGVLIDIRPTTRRAEILARTKEGLHFIGYLEETEDQVEYAQAEAALEQAIQAGIFAIDYEDHFTFSDYTDTIQSLEKYLAENWKDAILTPAVLDAALTLQNAPGGVAEIELTEHIHIVRLRYPGQA